MKYHHHYFLILLATILAMPLRGMEQPADHQLAIAALGERVDKNQSQNMQLISDLMRLREEDQKRATARERELQNQIDTLAHVVAGLQTKPAAANTKEVGQDPSLIQTLAYSAVVQIGLEAMAPGNPVVKVIAPPISQAVAKKGLFCLLPPKISWLIKVGIYGTISSKFVSRTVDYLPDSVYIMRCNAKYDLRSPKFNDFACKLRHLSNDKSELEETFKEHPSFDKNAIDLLNLKIGCLRAKLKEFKKCGGHGYEKDIDVALAELIEVEKNISCLQKLCNATQEITPL